MVDWWGGLVAVGGQDDHVIAQVGSPCVRTCTSGVAIPHSDLTELAMTII